MSRKPEEWISFNCDLCGKKTLIMPSIYRERVAKAKYGKVFCSRECGTKNRKEMIANKKHELKNSPRP